MTDWQANILHSSEQLRDLLLSIRRVAVLGIKTERQAGQPAFYVPQYLAAAGYEIIPVPVYYPEVTEILGQPVYRRLSDIPAEIDLVNVFRRSEDIDQHVEEIIAKAPKAVWFQLGIRNDPAAERLAKAGIQVVQNRCIMVDHRQLAG
jgi:predicted CoA-binding protein